MGLSYLVGHLRPWRSQRRESGSALMLVMFTCLAVAVVVQVLSTVVLCAERSLVDESTGRARLAEKDWTLAAVRRALLEKWQPLAPRTWEVPGDWGARPAEGWAEEVPDSGERLMVARARQDPDLSLSTISAWAERGRDGLDLPGAAVVAGMLTASTDRRLSWVDVSPDAATGEPDLVLQVRCYVADVPSEPLLGASCVLLALRESWGLDSGWRQAVEQMAAAQPVDVGGGEGTYCRTGESGTCLPWPGGGDAGGSPDAPVLVVVTGGADLDARNMGDLYGVIVVDDGSVLLDGTVVHGAVFATDSVELGETGRILYCRGALRWATDQSLRRVRLVPGTRSEVVE